MSYKFMHKEIVETNKKGNFLNNALENWKYRSNCNQYIEINQIWLWIICKELICYETEPI